MRLGGLVLALVAGMLGTAPAGERDPPLPGLREARGKVEAVDKTNRRLTLTRGAEPALVLQLDRATTVFINGQVGRLDELKQGQEIRASFEPKEGLNRAQWIETAKGAKSPSPGR